MAMPTGGPHFLEHEWVIWEHRAPDKNSKSYEDNMSQLCEIATVEDFWKAYNNIPKPSAIFFDGRTRKKFKDRTVESFSLFKKNIKPEWEDVQNRTGAEWFCRKTFPGPQLDEFWQSLVLGMIGETIDPNDDICGARVVDKSGARGGNAVFRIELWLKTKDEKISKRLKEKMIEIMTEGKGGRNLSDQFQWKLHGL